MVSIWRHKKSGGLYVVIDDDITIEATEERGVLYLRVQDGRKWVRSYSQFHDGRFEALNSYEYLGDGKVVLSHSDAF
jgi:hypothetical protein